jgi:ParB-like chromosome segregation protein Spo0J
VSDFESSVEAVSSFSAPTREGLPSSYRMRAEGHYVDLLASRASGPRDRIISTHKLNSEASGEPSDALVDSIRRHGVLQPLIVQEHDDEFRVLAGHRRLRAARAAGLREVPCIVHQVGNDKAAQLAEASNIAGVDAPVPTPVPAPEPAIDPALHGGASLAQSLATIASCADLLSSSPSDLTRSVVANLIQAESARAGALVLATRIVRRELPMMRAAVDISAVLDKVAKTFSAERKVRRIAVDVKSGVASGTCVAGDEALIAGALAAAVLATLPLVDALPEATVLVSATAEPGRVVATVTQRHVVAIPAWSGRALDAQWSERPGGPVSLIALLAAKQVADAHAGELEVKTDSNGTAIAISFPATS